MQPKVSVLPSTKILTDNIETLDLVNPDVEFDFDRYSKGIADIIKGSKPQFSIGIYGDWGTGKTTLMNLVQKKLCPEIVSWNKIPADSSSNEDLRRYLKDAFELKWIDSQEIQKTNDEKSIQIHDKTSSNILTLARNPENTKATLRINYQPVYDFIVDNYGENGDLTLRENNILTIWFNAWRYESEENSALIPLMKTIAYAMGEHPIYRHIKPIIMKALFIIGKDILRHYATQYVMTERGIDEFERNIANRLDRSAEFEKDVIYFDGMKKIQEEMEKILRKYPDTRIVIFVDDLDRCDPDKALQVFESIKVFLDIKGFIFVLGLSKSALLKLIQIKLDKMGLDNTKAEEYIRKIIQVDINIKKWTTEAIDTLINKHLNKLDKEINAKIRGGEKSNNVKLIEDIVELNPRQAKRLINNLIVSIAANPSLNTTAFLVVESVKKWKVFYQNISDVKFLKFCKRTLDMPPKDRERYLIKLNKELEEKIKSDDKLTDLERKIAASTEEFLDSNLWSFLEKEKDIIFLKISSDESEATEEEISIAKDYQTAKVASESVEDVKPMQESADTKAARARIGYAIDYYLELNRACRSLLEMISRLERVYREYKSVPIGETQRIVREIQNMIDDTLKIYLYRKPPSTSSGEREELASIHIQEIVNWIDLPLSRILVSEFEFKKEFDSVEDFNKFTLDVITGRLRKEIKELNLMCQAKLDDNNADFEQITGTPKTVSNRNQ